MLNNENPKNSGGANDDDGSSKRLLLVFIPTAVIVVAALVFLSRVIDSRPLRRDQLFSVKDNVAKQASPHAPKLSRAALAKIALGNSSSVKSTNVEDLKTSSRSRSSERIDNVPYCFPFAPGNTFLVSQAANGETHKGKNRFAIDFQMPVATSVHAARGGLVVRVEQGFDQRGLTEEVLSKANIIVIKHTDSTYASYAHLERRGSAVRVGDFVKAGQKIGYSGNTGFSTGPHLHFEISIIRGDSTDSVPVSFKTAQEQIISVEAKKSYTAAKVCDEGL